MMKLCTHDNEKKLLEGYTVLLINTAENQVVIKAYFLKLVFERECAFREYNWGGEWVPWSNYTVRK